jgi:cytochrome c biogenesis protein CcmG, thiol:disulfide interchange protein DsbE
MKAARFLVPLAVFFLLVFFLWRGLGRDPHEVPSPLLGKVAPQFVLPGLKDQDGQVSSDSMKGKVWLLNFWGSWCFACRDEHPTLMRLDAQHVIPIVGVDWKDEPSAGRAWLESLGDPYLVTVKDATGAVAINYGVYGAPESFLIDREGVIRKKYIGAITDAEIQNEVIPLVRELSK